MRRNRSLLLLLAVLALLTGTYFYLKNKPVPDSTAKTKVTPTETIAIDLSKLDEKQLVKIVLKTKNESLTLIKKGSDWRADYPYPVNLNQETLWEIISLFTGLAAQEIIDSQPKDLAQFGLANPAVSATAILADKTAKIFYLGDKAPTGSAYYFMIKGDPKIYTVSESDSRKFHYTFADIRDKSLATINPQEVTYFKLSKPGNRTIEIKLNDKLSAEKAQYGLEIWQVTQPYQVPKPVRTEQFQQILEAIAGLGSINEFIADNPQDLSRYGLSSPQAELLVKDKQNTFHLFIGKARDESFVYCKTKDAKAVFTLSKDNLSFLDTKPFDLIDRFVYIVNIEDVDQIDINAGGKIHAVTLSRRIKKAAKKGDEDETITTYRIDGKKIDEQPFKTFYQQIIGLLAESENGRNLAAANPQVTISYSLNKGNVRKVSIQYVPYDQDFYAVYRDGRSEFLISREQVDKMLKALGALTSKK